MKRRTRKQWYQFHLSRAQEEACSGVRAHFDCEIKAIEATYDEVRRRLADARASESLGSRFLSCFGIDSEYRRANIRPLEEDIEVAYRANTDLRMRQSEALREAAQQGEASYLRARELRKAEAEDRAKRVAARKEQKRIEYLETSPSIRSAARFLKRILLGEALSASSSVVCFYCQIEISPSDSHLEHKRPVCRGGDNRRGNLVLSCSSCNLKKGRRTHEEFLRDIGRSPKSE